MLHFHKVQKVISLETLAWRSSTSCLKKDHHNWQFLGCCPWVQAQKTCNLLAEFRNMFISDEEVEME